MILFGNGIITNMFRYKVSGFTGKQLEKPKIGDSYGNSGFITATGGRPPPVFFL